MPNTRTEPEASQSATDPRPGRSAKRRSSAPLAGERRHEQSHGSRLLEAIDALESFPALAESRERLLAVLSKTDFSSAEAAWALESDVALTISALRLANRKEKGPGRVESVLEAVEALGPETLKALGEHVGTFEFFATLAGWDSGPESFRQHALSTQRIADRLAVTVGYEHRDRLSAASLLHDIGKLVLLRAYPDYPGRVHGAAKTPEQRIAREQRVLGIDHALIGGALVRRWGLPKSLALSIERHHERSCEGDGAFIALADMLAHHERGESISPNELLESARAIGLGRKDLRLLMYELPTASSQRRRHIEPCPLSARELGILRLLAQGKVYKQIGVELSLSTSTVRTYLHNLYPKLCVVDRAQAVLIATQRGWL